MDIYKLDRLLDDFDAAELELQAAWKKVQGIRRKIAGLTFQQATMIAERGHQVGYPGALIGYRPMQLVGDKAHDFSATARQRRDYCSFGLIKARKSELAAVT